MAELQFERTKYGKELLIDACNQDELDIVDDKITLNFYTLLFLKKGSGKYFIDVEDIPFQNETIIFIKPAQINQVSQAVFEECILLFFEGDFLDDFFSNKDFIFKFGFFHNPELPSFLKLNSSDFDKFYNLAAELREEIHHQNPDSVHILRSIVYYLLIRLNQRYASTYGASTETLSDPTLLSFLNLLESNVRSKHGVEYYAQKLTISRVQLNKLCKNNFSKTANQLIRERKIAEIKKAIKYSSQNFSEIAYDFNFSAPSHFSRFVKQMTGQSPQELKEHLSNW